jgi:hypothetical protein
VRPVKPLEEVGTLVFGDAQPIVVHFDDGLRVCGVIRGSDLSANLDPPLVLRGVGLLDRVREEVGEA